MVVNNLEDFWATTWDFIDIKASQVFDKAIDDPKKMPGAKFFVNSKLNFARTFCDSAMTDLQLSSRVKILSEGLLPTTSSMMKWQGQQPH